MFTTLTLIAIAAAVAYVSGRLSAGPLIRRLRTDLCHDPLTGLYNRAGLLATHATIQPPQPILVALIDLDDFKQVNDEHGHDAGDRLLAEIAARIGGFANHLGGIAARLSGDEFAAVLPVRHNHPEAAARALAARIAQPVWLAVDGTALTVTVTASVGYTLADSDQALEPMALRHADIAAYCAKQHGGNRSVLFRPAMAMPANTLRRGPRLRDRCRTTPEAAA